MAQTAQDSFNLALKHLERVAVSWDDPTDWLELSTFGFYCLEACVVAAALQLKRTRPGSHRAKAEEARYLTTTHHLPDIEKLLVDLNTMRKSEAYGDVEPPDNLDPQEVASEIEAYVEQIGSLLQ
ncbi:MAG: hypothetical protein OXB92_00690 [Acidimicrobiaceae bacterium]|nr:hypothetical protein [Acidimicrobiia bacterium]MCY4492358.1 hypothetical protein [Acidimicrobiaceae bacterium]